jgi:hypothetical protein
MQLIASIKLPSLDTIDNSHRVSKRSSNDRNEMEASALMTPEETRRYTPGASPQEVR